MLPRLQVADSADPNTSFERAVFAVSGSFLESWMATFPDPSNYPSHFTRSLHLSYFKAITLAISDALPRIRTFSNIVELAVTPGGADDWYHISLTQLHGLSPNLKYFHISDCLAPLSGIHKLI